MTEPIAIQVVCAEYEAHLKQQSQLQNQPKNTMSDAIADFERRAQEWYNEKQGVN
jgi:hypothetical protein